MRFTRRKLLVATSGLATYACGSRPPPAHEQFPGAGNVAFPLCSEQWVHLPTVVPFAQGTSSVDEPGRQLVAEFVRRVEARTDIRRVRVEGHSAPCPPESGDVTLSEARASAVAILFVAGGLPRERIDTVGYGATQPRAECDANAEEANARVEFTVLVCREPARAVY